MDHLSSSQITLYLMCGLKYKYQYLDKLPKSFRPSALAFGSAIHSALAWYNSERLKGNGVPIDTLYKVFDADWYSQKAELEVRYKEGEQEMALVSVGKELLTLYTRLDLPKVRGWEIPFTVPITDVATGEALDVDLKGFFDLIEGEGTIVEFKTSAQALSPLDLDTRVQFTAYSYAYELLYGQPPKELRVLNLIKAKKPRIAEAVTSRDRESYRGFFHLTKEVLKGIRAGVFVPHPGYYCKECEYAKVCPVGPRR